jgi:DDE_Tnp_1-associated
MEEVAESFGANAETIVFLDHFKELPDPRQRGNVLCPMDEILLLCLRAVLPGARTLVDIALFGWMNLGLLRRPPAFLNFSAGYSKCLAVFDFGHFFFLI